MFEYNPSVYNDRHTVLEQLETTKDLIKEAAAKELTGITTLQNDVDNIKPRVSTLEADMSKVKGNIDEIIMDVSDLRNTELGELRTEFEEHADEANKKIGNLEAKALKTPMSAPYTDVLVAINTNNTQNNLIIGNGLSIENGNTLVATGGGGGGGSVRELTFMAELTSDGQDFSLPGTDCLISIRGDNFRATAVIAGQGESSYPYTFSTEFIYLDSVADIQKGYIESEDGSCYLRISGYDYSSPITIYAKAI